MEGERPAGRMVILQFKDEYTFWEWYNSPEYEEAKPHRFAGSDMKFLALVKGH